MSAAIYINAIILNININYMNTYVFMTKRTLLENRYRVV